jgi:hypothetical protein
VLGPYARGLAFGLRGAVYDGNFTTVLFGPASPFLWAVRQSGNEEASPHDSTARSKSGKSMRALSKVAVMMWNANRGEPVSRVEIGPKHYHTLLNSRGINKTVK